MGGSTIRCDPEIGKISSREPILDKFLEIWHGNNNPGIFDHMRKVLHGTQRKLRIGV